VQLVLTTVARLFGIRTRREFRLALRALAILLGACGAFAVDVLMEMHQFCWAIIPSACLIVLAIVEFVLADYLAEHSYPIETEKKLALLERQLGMTAVETLAEKLRRTIQSFRACDVGRVSGTVHIIIELSPSAELKTRYGLLQLTNYVGPYGGSKGRILTLEKGIIGRCARTGKVEYANFEDVTEYRRRMVQEFGFTHEEAEAHTTVARSYLAEPLLLSGTIIGVLYFFSPEAQVFPIAASASNLENRAQDFVDLLKTISIV
jgi:hypothetical protein